MWEKEFSRYGTNGRGVFHRVCTLSPTSFPGGPQPFFYSHFFSSQGRRFLRKAGKKKRRCITVRV